MLRKQLISGEHQCIEGPPWQAHVAGQQRTAAISERAEAEKQRGHAEWQAMEAAKQRDAAQAASDRAGAAERAATRERDRSVAAESRAQQARNVALAEKRRADSEADTATAINNFLQNETLAAMSALGEVYRNQGKYEQAEPLLTKALELSYRVVGEEHPNTAGFRRALGMLYLIQGKYEPAEALLTKALEAYNRALGEEHPNTLTAMNSLAGVYFRQAKYAQAKPLLAKYLEAQRRLLGEEHPNTLTAMNNLARLYSHQGKFAQAEPLLTNTLEVRPKHRLCDRWSSGGPAEETAEWMAVTRARSASQIGAGADSSTPNPGKPFGTRSPLYRCWPHRLSTSGGNDAGVLRKLGPQSQRRHRSQLFSSAGPPLLQRSLTAGWLSFRKKLCRITGHREVVF